MHREFLKLLEKATGVSEHVVAVNIDIRGFTPFCQSVESLDVATYIKKIYSKIITDYFENASYYKPTGDGLIITIPYDEENLREVANSTIDSCLDLIEKFGSLCIKEDMINYPTPQKIGIGLTRGSACCITSEDKILDYSGRILNLASRLMDIARPSGIVFDEAFGIDLLPDETKELFLDEEVYVRGVAEEDPIKIHYTKKHTLIPNSYRKPLKEPRWNTDSDENPLKALKSLEGPLQIELSRKPLDENKITAVFSFDNPKVEGFRRFHSYSIEEDEIDYQRMGNTCEVFIDIVAIVKSLEEEGVTEDMNIRIDVTYPIK